MDATKYTRLLQGGTEGFGRCYERLVRHDLVAAAMDKPSIHHADLHVERLHYSIESDEGIRYENPVPLSFPHPIGSFHADGGRLTVKPVDHFGSAAEARTVVDPILRAWEIETDLSLAVGTIRFKFDRADIIDRSPREPGSATIYLQGVASLGFVGSLTAVAVRRAYPPPPPPQTFLATPDVQVAHQRWREFAAGREQLTGMGYFVLTLLQEKAGGRKKAAALFQMEEDVLRMVGNLTTNKGGPAGARKADGVLQELSVQERKWLEEAIKIMIRRMAQTAAGSSVSTISMQDLPKL